MHRISPSPTSEGFDLRAILQASLTNFAPWLVSVLVVTWAGYPGVVCVTPLAWLLALRVGISCVSRSVSPSSSRRLQEAALAGGLFGLFQGLLFWVVIPRMGPIQPNEQMNAALIVLVMLVLGVLVASGLSVFCAYLVERKLAAEESPG